MIKLGNYLKKAVSTGLGNSIGSALIASIFIPLVINNIGIEKYGIWAILNIFISASSIADLGLSKSLVYFIPRQKSQKDINEVFSTGFFLNVLLVILLIVVGFVIYWAGINVWGNNKSFSYELGRKLFLCGFIITCFSLHTGLYRSVLEAFYKIHIVNIGYFLLTFLNYTSLYVLSQITDKIEYLAINTTIIYIVIFFFHFSIARIKTSVSLHIPKLESAKEIVKYAIAVFSIGILSIILHPINQYLVIRISKDAKVYGIFDFALKISMMALSCLQAFAVPIFSVFANYGKERIVEIKHILDRYLIGLGGCYIFGSILFFLVGKHILHFLIKEATADLFYLTLVLILGITLWGVAEPFFRAFLALGDLQLSLKLKVIRPIIYFLFIVLLAKITPLYRFGMAYSLAFAVTAIIFISIFKIKYSNHKEVIY